MLLNNYAREQTGLLVPAVLQGHNVFGCSSIGFCGLLRGKSSFISLDTWHLYWETETARARQVEHCCRLLTSFNFIAVILPYKTTQTCWPAFGHQNSRVLTISWQTIKYKEKNWKERAIDVNCAWCRVSALTVGYISICFYFVRNVLIRKNYGEM